MKSITLMLLGVLLLAGVGSGCWRLPAPSIATAKRVPDILLEVPRQEVSYIIGKPGLVVTSDDLIVFGENDLYAVDSAGRVQWRYAHGETTYPLSEASDIEGVADGLLVTGVVTLSPYYEDPPEHYVAKLSEAGQEQWRRTYEVPELPEDYGENYYRYGAVFAAVAALPDGGFAIAGGGALIADDYPLVVIRADAAGAVTWTLEQEASLTDVLILDAKALGAGGDLLVYGARRTRADHVELLFFKITAAGALDWVRIVDDVVDAYLDAEQYGMLAAMPDGGFAVAVTRGYSPSFGSIIEIGAGGEINVLKDIVAPAIGSTLGYGYGYGALPLSLEHVDGNYLLGLTWAYDAFPQFRFYEIAEHGEVLEEKRFWSPAAPHSSGRLSDGRWVHIGERTSEGVFEPYYNPSLLVEPRN